MTTRKVVQLWARQAAGKGGAQPGSADAASIHYEGPRLRNYGTIIGFVVGNVAYVTTDKYSATTSGHQNAAAGEARAAGREVRRVTAAELAEVMG